MAVFLLRSRFGPTYEPPPATGTVFLDVGVLDFAAAWIEELYELGITDGCGPQIFCPLDPVSREQMAVFLLATREGTGYDPPPATGIFDDVPITSIYAAWIEELSRRGITAGCAVDLYCPERSVTRGEMAVFLAETFSLPL
jgi:N-acetylmuramoyl-L-alanine amidase